jgi:pyruvate-ferredoxin/flavodoxin oxidoreductase
MGAKDEHTLRAFLEAEAYPGASLIIAYSHCIAHGINMTGAMQHQKAAVDSGHWLLYRYNSRARTTRKEPAAARLFRPEDARGAVHVHGESFQDAEQE